MGKNAQRRRGAKLVKQMLRRMQAPAPASQQLSQLAQEHSIPNRAERRRQHTPTWYSQRG